MLTSALLAVSLAATANAGAPAAAPINGSQVKQAEALLAVGATGVQLRSESTSETYSLHLGAIDDTGKPLTGREKFRAGSITKLVTSTAVLKLAEQGKLDLDQSIESYLPGKLNFGSRVTVRQLLNQTSGLPTNAYETQLPFDPETMLSLKGMQKFLRQKYTDDQLLGYIDHTGLTAAPGSKWQYSNANYIILGQLITAVAHQPYQHYIAKQVFRPLGMEDSRIPLSDNLLPGPAATGYQPPAFYGGQVGEPLIDLSRQHSSLFGAAGALITTTHDLNLFQRGLFEGKLLSQKSLDQMYTQGAANPAGYGLGVIQVTTPCGVIRGHNRSVYGYQSAAFYLNGKAVSVSLTEGTNSYGTLTGPLSTMAFSALCPAAPNSAGLKRQTSQELSTTSKQFTPR